MIRVVFDTNIVISGILWSGTPHLLMQMAVSKQIKAIISETMLDELEDVIERPKFIDRLKLIGKSSAEAVESYAAITEIVDADEDDDHVLACALSSHADFIVSGDPHLLEIKHYKNIPILTASEFLALLSVDR